MSRRYIWITVGVALILLIGAAYYRRARAKEVRAAIDQAIDAIQSQQLDEAVVFLQAALAQKPDEAEARFLLAQTHMMQNNLESALTEFRQLPPDFPQAEMVMVQSAGILLGLNRPGESERLLHECLERFPESVAARQYLLDVLALQLRQAEMIDLLEELWQLAAERGVKDRVWVLAKRLHVLFIRPNEEDQWQTLQAFAREEPENVHNKIALAKLKLMMNADVPQAAQSLENCLEQSPENLEAISALAMHYVEQADVPAETIENLLDRWSNFEQTGEYWQARGDWHARKGELDEALDSYRQAQQLSPSEWRIDHKIGLLLIRMSKQSDEPDTALAKEGEESLAASAAIKETRLEAAKHFEYLQEWLSGTAPTDRFSTTSLPVSKFLEIARFCESVRCDSDALRWCDLVQTVAPQNPDWQEIRRRVTAQTKDR